jgi:hypothetical protein
VTPSEGNIVAFHGVPHMVRMGTAVMCVVGAVALMAVIFLKRPADVGKLGSVSDRWIAQHRAGS